MKKSIKYLSIILFTAFTMVSCFPEDINEEKFDETLLYGKWKAETLFYNYKFDGTGTTWDTSDDVTEEEAQNFTWTLESSELTHIYILEIGGSVPKIYTITELTATKLTYEDDFGNAQTFTKVEDTEEKSEIIA